jgi:hypothetical protein
MGFEFFAAIVMKVDNFLDIAPCNLMRTDISEELWFRCGLHGAMSQRVSTLSQRKVSDYFWHRPFSKELRRNASYGSGYPIYRTSVPLVTYFLRVIHVTGEAPDMHFSSRELSARGHGAVNG